MIVDVAHLSQVTEQVPRMHRACTHTARLRTG
jgi:hypothetical protein